MATPIEGGGRGCKDFFQGIERKINEAGRAAV